MCFQHFPNSTSLYPISFALSYVLVTYVASPKGGDYNAPIYFGIVQSLIKFVFDGPTDQ
jgi:hypothetical protein